MKITVLAENTAKDSGLTAEHGLSLFVETDNHKILFDMGQTDAFVKNALSLGVDLTKADIAVLSHGHYDHGGGIKAFLKLNSIAPVYLNREAFGRHFNGSEKYIGLDQDLKNNDRLVFVDEELRINDEMLLLSCNGKEKCFATEPFGLNIEINGVMQSERFHHEQYLLIEENGKRVLFSGCSHKGILNIQQWFQPDAFVGGFHLSKLDPATADCEKLKDTADTLLKYKTKYYTAHCTGVAQYEYLKTVMGESIEYLSTGCCIII
ncbi:MAG: MBL fold metallo-hydrolase [Clostridia bacterium]|nr:MBL fold metallo-hydrolase [Clostridia bacterium]